VECQDPPEDAIKLQIAYRFRHVGGLGDICFSELGLIKKLYESKRACCTSVFF
jgi:hypothetical protein